MTLATKVTQPKHLTFRRASKGVHFQESALLKRFPVIPLLGDVVFQERGRKLEGQRSGTTGQLTVPMIFSMTQRFGNEKSAIPQTSTTLPFRVRRFPKLVQLGRQERETTLMGQMMIQK